MIIKFDVIKFSKQFFIFFVSSILVLSSATYADLNDGTLLGISTLLDSGDPSDKLDIVFIGDGFTDSEQDLFNDKVDQAVSFFLDTHPFMALRCAFNIHRINVASRESGTDIPGTCGVDDNGDPIPSPRPAQSRATALNTTYCGGTVFRCLGSSDFTLIFNYTVLAPGSNFIVVLVNDKENGGCRWGTTTFVAISSRFDKVVVHELGHAIADLADEYDADDPGKTTYSGPEPGRTNITIETNRGSLKWGDLVLNTTLIPTTTCDDPDFSGAADLVGTFEGANGEYKCGIYRPQNTCRMRRSEEAFCAVCRRAIIEEVKDKLCDPLGVYLTELHIKNDHDGWSRGKGDIYFNYTLESNTESISGRWPASGDVGIGTGSTRSLENYFVGLVPEPRSGESGSFGVKVRDNDWPDGDDKIREDATTNFTGVSNIDIDERDYHLQGQIRPGTFKVLFDFIHIKNDMDGALAGAGDVFINYRISNAEFEVKGRWPASGNKKIDTRETAEIALLAAAIARPTDSNQLSIHVEIWDDDGWLTFGDDNIGEDTFTFGAASNFGANTYVHVQNQENYRLTLSIID